MDKLKEHIKVLAQIKLQESRMTKASKEGINARSIALLENDPTNPLAKIKVLYSEPQEQMQRMELLRLYELADSIRKEARGTPKTDDRQSRLIQLKEKTMKLFKKKEEPAEYDPSYFAPNGKRITLDDFGWPQHVGGDNNCSKNLD